MSWLQQHQRETKNVHVVLAALASDTVVLSILITFIHTRHVLVVQYYRVRALHRGPRAILLPSLCSVCDVCLRAW